MHLTGTDAALLTTQQELDPADGWGAVTCMHSDGHGNVWAGFQSGGIGVWSRAQRRHVCLPLQCCKTAVRCKCKHRLVCSRLPWCAQSDWNPPAVPEFRTLPSRRAKQRAATYRCRVIVADGCGHAYIGSHAGDVMAVRLRYATTSGSATLEMAHSLLVQTNGVRKSHELLPMSRRTHYYPQRMAVLCMPCKDCL